MLFKPLLLFILTLPYLAFSQPLKVDVSASAAVLINGDTGEVIFEKNAHKFCFPASTTKIATALYALSQKGIDLDARVTASAEALGCVSPQVRRTKHPSHRLEFGGTHTGIKVGEELSFRDLLYGLMLASGNDSANVIAEYVSGSVPLFVEKMNAFLREQGLRETFFSNPHGLPCREHRTSAYDLAQMARLGMKIPLFREIVKTLRYQKPATNKQPETIFVQHNALLKRGGAHYYPKAVGIKTGYTVSAGQNLVAAAVDENRFLIAVVLGCTDFHQRYKDVIALFEAGFNEKKVSRTVLAKGFDLFALKIKGAKKPVQGALDKDFVFDYYPSEEPDFKVALSWLDLKLPIAKDAQVGEVRLVEVETGKTLSSAPLFATELVEISLAAKLKTFLLHKVSLLIMTISAFTVGVWLFFHRSQKRVKRKKLS